MTVIKEKPLFEKIIEAIVMDDEKQLNILITQSKNIISCGEYEYSQALQTASYYGHIECIKLIIPLSDPKDNNSFPLRLASQNGHIECVRLLIPVSDPKSNKSLALRIACENGHAECAKLLTPVSDPKTKNSYALQLAAEYNYKDCVELLLPHSDISKWCEKEWKNIDSGMQNIIQSYFLKLSLIQNIAAIGDKTLKIRKPHKI